MKIGIISDTHNHKENLTKAANHLNKIGVSLILHCGDWTSPEFLEEFQTFQMSIKGVLGNCDTLLEVYEHRLNFSYPNLDLELKKDKLEIETDTGTLIGITHGFDEAVLEKLINNSKCRLICRGHTHKALIERKGDKIIVNPGSIVGRQGLSGEISVTPTLAIYDTQKNIAEIIKLV